VTEYPTGRYFSIDHPVDVIGPHVEPVQQPRTEGANLYDCLSHKLAGLLRLQQERPFLHLASTIGLQRSVSRDPAPFTVATHMVETPTFVAGQPRPVASERDQIQHNEEYADRTPFLTSTLYPALTGGAG
jgi:hypothetical protein